MNLSLGRQNMTSTYLGGGGYGEVYKEWVHGQWCAVKKVPECCTTDEEMYRECDICRNIEHPNVVKLIAGIEKHENMWHIPLEFIEGETLKNIIFHPTKTSIQLTQTVTAGIITGMCEGLLHLHSKDIVHRDIKPDNIMVERGTYRAVIIDLGFAKFHCGGLNPANNRGNPAYVAPEIIRSPFSEQDHRSDVWALGKVIAELLVGHQLPSSRISCSYIQDLLKDSSAYCETVSAMLEASPTPRATMASVINQIRAAAGRVDDKTMASSSSVTKSDPAGASSVQLDTDMRSIDLPPGFSLPDPLPPNHTVMFNYITRDRREGLTQIKGEIQTRQGRIQGVWWTKCEAK